MIPLRDTIPSRQAPVVTWALIFHGRGSATPWLQRASDIDADVLQLMTLYPQPIRRQPTVEYLPGQRHAPSKKEGS